MTRAEERVGRAFHLARAAFGESWQPTIQAAANGRIEVIGNHIDYSGGPVLAAAIDRGITLLAAHRTDGVVRIAFPDIAGGEAHEVHVAAIGDWRAHEPIGAVGYLQGVIAAARARGLAIHGGMDVLVHGDIPIGGGVSSSAALCVGLALTLVDGPIAKPELVLLAQEAEHRAGTPCGTMDQSASVFGGLILFGGSPYLIDAIAADLGEFRFVVLGSGVQRSLSTSAYGERVEESTRALAILRRATARHASVLADFTPAEVEAGLAGGAFDGAEAIHLRARHVATEVVRVREAIVALSRRDWPAFGRLMTQSGASSATDYAISHPTVERLVALARTVRGVLGARMMGGGEGGNALALLDERRIPALAAHLASEFYGPAGLEHTELMFTCRLGEAASVRALGAV